MVIGKYRSLLPADALPCLAMAWHAMLLLRRALALALALALPWPSPALLCKAMPPCMLRAKRYTTPCATGCAPSAVCRALRAARCALCAAMLRCATLC